jgi:hypothetical protein
LPALYGNERAKHQDVRVVLADPIQLPQTLQPDFKSFPAFIVTSATAAPSSTQGTTDRANSSKFTVPSKNSLPLLVAIGPPCSLRLRVQSLRLRP